jgi:hypothetical protein
MTPRSEQTSADEAGDCVRCSFVPWDTRGQYPMKRGALVATEDGTMLVPRIIEGE